MLIFSLVFQFLCVSMTSKRKLLNEAALEENYTKTTNMGKFFVRRSFLTALKTEKGQKVPIYNNRLEQWGGYCTTQHRNFLNTGNNINQVEGHVQTNDKVLPQINPETYNSEKRALHTDFLSKLLYYQYSRNVDSPNPYDYENYMEQLEFMNQIHNEIQSNPIYLRASRVGYN